MEEVKALFFDVGGTIFDWKNTARGVIEELAHAQATTIDSEAFANDWRSEMFKIHNEVRNGNMPWINSDEMHLKALENLMATYPLLGAIDRRGLVKSTWHKLKSFPGAAEAIERLRTRYIVVVLTILNWESIVKSSKAANVQWDGILSCEFLGYYKPSLQAYLRAVELLGLNPSDAMMVAAHEGDLAAAQKAGLRTGLVSVPEEDNLTEGFGQTRGGAFDIKAVDFEDMCRQLGVMS
ncbi:MAG: HAD family hydrolase [Spirochaetia bacterium]